MRAGRVGQQYGQLTIVRPVRKYLSKRHPVSRHRVLCKCSCGRLTILTKYELWRTSHPTRSCGCRQVDVARRRLIARNLLRLQTTHGQAGTNKHTKEYCAWSAARQRCRNPNVVEYPAYGGRGIECNLTFEEWFAELGPKPEPKRSYSVGRIDGNKNYDFGNIEWQTRAQQEAERANRRKA